MVPEAVSVFRVGAVMREAVMIVCCQAGAPEAAICASVMLS